MATHINKRPSKTGAQHVIDLLGVNISTAVTVTALSARPVFIVKTVQDSSVWATFS